MNKIKVTTLFLFSLLSLNAFARSEIKMPAKAAPPMMPNVIDMSVMSSEEMEDYYTSKGSIVRASGAALRESLNAVITDHREYDYNSTSGNNNHRLVFKIIDRNWTLSPLNENELSNFNYNTDMPYIYKLYAAYNNDVETAHLFYDPAIPGRVSFDREHIWAQSLGDFGRGFGAGGDFHALWPSDIRGNQAGHSNYNFGIPTSSIADVIGDDEVTSVGRNGYNRALEGTNKVFEPLDEYKGDIARAMFYMATRYIEHKSSIYPHLELVDESVGSSKSSATQSGKAGILKTLLDWNEQDPVSEYEIRRNNLLYYNYQLNRNPYIDHPEWARAAYDPNYSGEGVSIGDPGEEPPISEEPPVSSEPTSEIDAPKRGCRGGVETTLISGALLLGLSALLFYKRKRLN